MEFRLNGVGYTEEKKREAPYKKRRGWIILHLGGYGAQGPHRGSIANKISRSVMSGMLVFF